MITVTAKRELRPDRRTIHPRPDDYHYCYVLSIGPRSRIRLQSVLHYETVDSAIQAGERSVERLRAEGNGDK